MEVNIYLEDWSNGMIHSEEYVFYMMDSLKDENILKIHASRYTGYSEPGTDFQFL